jgi:hypothetical protein
MMALQICRLSSSKPLQVSVAALGKRDLQLDATVHVPVQSWIDEGRLDGGLARLYSHLIRRQTLDTGTLWSISRDPAKSIDDYTGGLENCDMPRRSDLDGRGSLS